MGRRHSGKGGICRRVERREFPSLFYLILECIGGRENSLGFGVFPG